MLRPADPTRHPELLVGLGAADDAAVYRVAADLALVETVDFFPPVVDEPYDKDRPKSVAVESDAIQAAGPGAVTRSVS